MRATTCPSSRLSTPMTDVIYEMSSKKLGMTTVQEAGKLRGVISDGDLRRLLEREGGAALEQNGWRGNECEPSHDRRRKNWRPKRWRFSKSARSLRWSSSMHAGKVEGVVHLHDLWGVELI